MSKQNTINSNGDFDIILEDVTVRYQLPDEQVRTFKEYAINFVQGKNKKRSFLAMDRINLKIVSGEILV